jgi:hypothetical protein
MMGCHVGGAIVLLLVWAEIPIVFADWVGQEGLAGSLRRYKSHDVLSLWLACMEIMIGERKRCFKKLQTTAIGNNFTIASRKRSFR